MTDPITPARDLRAYAQRAYDQAWDDTDRDPAQAWRIEMWDRLVQHYDRLVRDGVEAAYY